MDGLRRSYAVRITGRKSWGEKMPTASAHAPEAALQQQLNRVMLHYRSGRHQAALDLIEQIDGEHGVLAEAMHPRGLALYALGQKAEGIALIREASEFLPEHGGIRADLGALLAQDGLYEEALVDLLEATELAPGYAGAWSNLGAAYFMLEEYDFAIPPLRRAVELEPSLLDAQRNLGTALAHGQRYKAAIDVFYRALAIDPNDVGLHLGLSGVLYRDERHDSALHHARKALELHPGLATANFHIGNALASLGKMDEAVEHLLKATEVMPAGLNALTRLVHLRKTRRDSPELAKLNALQDRMDQMRDGPRAQIHFAAGKAYADLGDYDSSFQHFSKGNALTAKEHGFDLDNHIAQVERMMAVVTPQMIDRMQSSAGITDIAPMFVCGMPRTGTTLTELMLSRHSKIRAGGELPASRVAFSQVRRLVEHLEETSSQDMQADDLTQVGEFYVEALRNEGLGHEFVTDKLPINYLYVGLLALALPRAKFVIMRRHPLDCCLSNWTQNFGRNQPFSTNFRDLGQVYMQYHRISEYWARLLPMQVKLLSYEALVTDPERQMREVLEFCGLGWEDAVLEQAASAHPVNTASIAQVREPIYQTSKAKWRDYGALLKPLAEEVGELLDDDEKARAGILS